VNLVLTPRSQIVVDFPFNGSSDSPGCVTLNFMMEFGKETGHNGTKLTNLFKEPLTNWQSATKRLDDHKKIPWFTVIPCCGYHTSRM
jgi:hypothetical protein